MPSIFLYALFGLFAGVLVNRAADNLPPPNRKSLLVPPTCRYCGTERLPYEQIGLLGEVIGRGRCHACRAPLPLRAPIVELSTAILFAFIGERFGLGLVTLAYSIFTAILLLIFVVDFEHRLILNMVVLPSTLAALLLSPLLHGNPSIQPAANLQSALASALLGTAVGYVVVFGVYLLGGALGRVFAKVHGRAPEEVPFGFGDVKLAGLVGALAGFPAIFYALAYTIFLAGIVALAVVLFQLASRRHYAPLTTMPYGPFFVVVAWAFMVWGPQLLNGLFSA